jgi:hypothetical protein
MKTAKYKIQFEYYDTEMSTEMEISKKAFNLQLAFLRQQVIDTKNNECPVTEYEPRTREHEGLTETMYHFNSGCADTYLFALVCKKGYHFAK